MAEDLLLHLIEPAGWRAALRRGACRPDRRGSCTCPRPDQVHLPAARLGLGATRCCSSSTRRGSTPRCGLEPGLPDDPEGMLFPHLLRAAADVGRRRRSSPTARRSPRGCPRRTTSSAVPWRSISRCRSAGPTEVSRRPRAGWRSSTGRTAGPATTTGSLLSTPGPPTRVEAAAPAVSGRRGVAAPGRALLARGGCGRRRARAGALDVEELLPMARPAGPPPGGGRAEVVEQAEVHGLWDRSWRSGSVAPDERDRPRWSVELVGREHRQRPGRGRDRRRRERGRPRWSPPPSCAWTGPPPPWSRC